MLKYPFPAHPLTRTVHSFIASGLPMPAYGCIPYRQRLRSSMNFGPLHFVYGHGRLMIRLLETKPPEALEGGVL